MKKFGFALLGTACVALSGCGAVNNVINSVIPEVDNLVKLNGTTVDATVGSGRAVISGNVSKSAEFGDTELPQVSQLRTMRLRQSLDTAIQVTMPSGKSLPASFSLSNIALRIRLSDSDARASEASATFAGPVTYTRDGTTSTYRTTTPVEVGNITFSNTAFSTARDIITTAPSPNSANGRLSFDTDDTQLPNGTVLRFTFVEGKAKVEL
ncbi:hypothetical protein [Armatimonas sp.]|uniref:hypothetical protein n=1 Tax=Armatimonas sp. TaxID=1872638 RepID=UPI00286BC61B|nr:hypothetical protein [Armatimonas sp.]